MTTQTNTQTTTRPRQYVCIRIEKATGEPCVFLPDELATTTRPLHDILMVSGEWADTDWVSTATRPPKGYREEMWCYLMANAWGYDLTDPEESQLYRVSSAFEGIKSYQRRKDALAAKHKARMGRKEAFKAKHDGNGCAEAA